MRASLFVLACFGTAVFAQEEEPKEAKPSPPKPLAILDVANSGEGSVPGGATPKAGRWSVDAAAKKLKLAPEPLIDGWLEFGPEIREKGATVTAAGRAPGEGRLQSWIGVAAYGKNGFQLRLKPVHHRLEIVRRGIVLESATFPTKPGTLYRFELRVEPDGEDWTVEGRIWKDDSDRPEMPLVVHKAIGAELLFPLAGRPGVIGTPFSGEPVQFAGAEVFGEGYEPLIEEKAAEADEE